PVDVSPAELPAAGAHGDGLVAPGATPHGHACCHARRRPIRRASPRGGCRMDKDALTAWALANGWQMIAGHPSLTKPSSPKEAIVRMVLKATVVTLEVKKPAGKWEKVSGAAYAKVQPDP